MNKYFKINNVLYEILYTKDNYVIYTDYEMTDDGIKVYGSKYSYIDNTFKLLETSKEEENFINKLWGDYLD